ncbi:hypothetical protein LIER_38908 [Lithospermum erythrorhizon]|uniref:NB-ARC domain-containing protein n=1 Tax=Lithospermum erythrorhizon TaxID=34254 RepID=A0AAV3Q796_LITER
MSIDRKTTSSIEESKIHRRDDDQNFLLLKVLGKNINVNMEVIPIVGAGGLGKTTLAQPVFNNEKVKERNLTTECGFVSPPHFMIKVAQGILEGIKVDHQGLTHLQTLHEKIKESVFGKIILLVLHDVWERLRMCLNCDATES